MICECGNKKFIAHQIIRSSIIVDENGEFLDDSGDGLEESIYDTDSPFGPFTCTKCNKEYEELTK